jgi:hypothetical protein
MGTIPGPGPLLYIPIISVLYPMGGGGVPVGRGNFPLPIIEFVVFAKKLRKS